MRIHRALAAFAVVAAPLTLATVATPAGASGSPTAGVVKGTITNAATGKALAGICVVVVEADDNTTVGENAPSNANGDWKLKNVPPDNDYTAVTSDCSSTGYVGQWYDDQDYQSIATQFAVTAAETTKKINFSLVEGGSVSGVVTDSSSGTPLQGVLVVALWTSQDSASTYSVCTSANGKYKLTDVPTSGAIVWFDTDADASACGSSTSYDSEYYLNAPTYRAASIVPVAAGKTTKNINQALTQSVG